MTSTLQLVTCDAIHGSVTAGLKRHLRLIPTTSAGEAIQLTWFAFAKPAATSTKGIPLPTTRLLVCGAALRAAARGIGQSPARIKFLLADGKRRGPRAVAAIQGLIGQWHWSSIPETRSPNGDGRCVSLSHAGTLFHRKLLDT
jgi:hypothetical protein